MRHLPYRAPARLQRHENRVAQSYEQTTYPEWAFSAYRTGETPDGIAAVARSKVLSLRNPARAATCPVPTEAHVPFVSKIAAIQEHSNFPQAEHGLPASDIDLQVRSGFAKHLLVGLNVFFIEMAKQFNQVLGIPTTDPMMGSLGVRPLDLTEQTMLDQASNTSAAISIGDLSHENDEFQASVTA